MNTKIIFAEISSVLDSATNDLVRLLSNARQDRIKKFRFDIDRKLSLYSDLLVRYQAYKELNLFNKEMVFSIHKNGKPYLCNNSEFHFNISHTRNAIAVAFSNSEIGVDIESVKSADLVISNRLFTSSEQDYITSHENPNHAFYEVWTKKEAFIKYTGFGLLTPLKSFDVLDNPIRSMLQTFEMKTYIISACCNDLIRIEPVFISMTERELHLLFSKIR